MANYVSLARAAAVRAVRTFAQTAVALVGTTAVVLDDVNWVVISSGGALAAVLSLLTSLAGLPEVDNNSGTDRSIHTPRQPYE